MSESITHTHCLLCEQLCGISVSVKDGVIDAIHPDKKNRYTWRDFCVKAQRAGEVVHSPWRLQTPMRLHNGKHVPATYEEAVADISGRLRKILDAHGPNAVAGYIGNPGGFNFGTAAYHAGLLEALGSHQSFSMFSVDSNAYHIAAGKMFGMEWLALIPDIDATDCALLIGSNPAVSKLCWFGKVPNGWRRLKNRIAAGADLIVVDPRKTETAERATLHLAPRPETDWALLLGVIKVIFANRWERLPPGKPVIGVAELQQLAANSSLDVLAAICDVPRSLIEETAKRFANAPRAFALAATGPGLGRNGSVSMWLSLALNVITDRIDRPGGRFMPNWPMSQAIYKAQVAPDSTIPSRVRGLPPVIGMHSVAELADEITTPGEGQVRALIIAGGNPVSSAADGTKLASAMQQLDLLVAIDLFKRDSQGQAHWIIPGEHFLERDELHVGVHALNDQPFIQSSRRVLPAPAGIRPEWTFYRDVAAALGIECFGGLIASPDQLSEMLLGLDGKVTYDEIRRAEHGLFFGERTLGHLWNYFSQYGGAVNVCPADLSAHLLEELASFASAPETNSHNYQIISRRRNGMMNGWLAETAGAVSPDNTPDTIEINCEDAVTEGIVTDALIRVESAIGSLDARALISEQVRAGTVVLVQGWGTGLYDPMSGEEVFRRGNERNKLVSDLDLDPFSGVARLNGTRVSLTRIDQGATAAKSC
ncbi:MAG: molybdopterin-dependent oxidoreductase [Spongiibacteraceae bacterium]